MDHLLSVHDLTAAEVADLLELATALKARPADYRQACAGRSLAMIFEKASTRTRVSFEVGIFQLGGAALFLSPRDIQMGRGEPIEDSAAVLGRYVDGIMARTFSHQLVVDLARFGTVPVINGLTDLLHPCQALSDLLTIHERFGGTRGLRLAYVGDGNNMAHSLMLAASKAGMDFAIASPDDYRMEPFVVEMGREDAAAAGTALIETADPREAVAGAHVVYTDVWASMGQENEHQQRMHDFAGFCVDGALMDLARPDAVFMHCLPAHRGEEVTAEVCDGPRSVIYDQAENRLHMQKAVMVRLMGG